MRPKNKSGKFSITFFIHFEIWFGLTQYALAISAGVRPLLIASEDPKRLGLKHGDLIEFVSATNSTGDWDLAAGNKKTMTGKVVLTQTMRPGVTSFALGFGHGATGAEDVTINGNLIERDPRRAAGIHANAAMWVDPALKNTCMVDRVGGSVRFCDT